MKTSFKISNLALLAMLAFGLLFSCKKGENDPFISLRSRKARIVGEWKLQKGFEKTTGAYPEAIVYGETTGTKTDDSGTKNFTYSKEYTFKNDGNYSYTYTEKMDGDTATIEKVEGRWTFMARNKPGKIKDKESILLTETKFTSEYAGNNNTRSDSNPTDGILFYINQLENKIMVVKATSNTLQTNGGNTITGTFEMEYTFIAK
jgi:hypothetical protein